MDPDILCERKSIHWPSLIFLKLNDVMFELTSEKNMQSDIAIETAFDPMRFLFL